jgi:hypothetical protein
MRARSVVRSSAAFAMFLASLASSHIAAADAPPLVASLHAGQAAFWDGGYADGSPTHALPFVPASASIDRCATTGPCFTYRLELLDAAADLRVGFSTPSRDDGFEITILDPAGASAARMSNNNQYNTETFINAPAAGIYTIKVAPYSADWAPFKMRAKLETKAYQPVPDASGRLLPDLRVTRLWEFGFVAPANPGNGLFPPDDVNPPADAAGVHPVSCGADEVVNDGVSRCLRFSFGLANVGDGNFDIRFKSDRTGAQTQNVQCIQRADATPLARNAGTSYFHQTHGHYHFQDVIYHRLLKVTDRVLGRMTVAGEGQKLGYSPADQSFPEWTRFVQSPSGSSGSAGTCTSTDYDSRLGLSRGWGDAYRYQRPGNFVDFNTNGDGYYVVQTTADPTNVVLESNDHNNTSYAYIRVEGDHVDVIESGVGRSPWDATKVPFE